MLGKKPCLIINLPQQLLAFHVVVILYTLYLSLPVRHCLVIVPIILSSIHFLCSLSTRISITGHTSLHKHGNVVLFQSFFVLSTKFIVCPFNTESIMCSPRLVFVTDETNEMRVCISSNNPP